MMALYGVSPADVSGMDTSRLRSEFLVETPVSPGSIAFVHTHVDRLILGGAVPTDTPLRFGDGAKIGTPLFFSAREAGIANPGGAGAIPIDGTRHELGNRDILYIDGDAVLSPAWSIHMGSGTGPYAFVWGMTGENQEYTDGDAVPVAELR